ncbi:MAG TPA: nucleotide pyrophosphatase/phosphodiesterase family protein [Cytophagaceae bacterium]|jgi:predicted AlkP superfamily pyrophosphatase or phosphodiesterase
MQKTVVINVVGLTTNLIGDHTPFLKKWLENKTLSLVNPVLPAVTCSVQSTYLTGKMPNEHGIVGNGWYFKDECEVKFWKQSNKLVQSPKIWDRAKAVDEKFTCANMFWWYNMYSGADYSVTPRPMYLADGRKMPDAYSWPHSLRDRLQDELGTFPLFEFWGPRTSIKSSQWIADASIKVNEWHDPTLTLIYLPHLDYCLQKFGAEDAKTYKDLGEIDGVCKQLIEYFEGKSTKVILVSEYGISNVDNPIHLNRVLRKNGLIEVREERGLELLDAGACKAFAVADHQVAHVYVNDVSALDQVKSILEKTPGIEKVLDKSGKQFHNIDHERAGDFVVIADKNSWFTYYYWLDDSKAPDFARIVDIHKKPGYDPVEMFANPDIKFLMPKVALKLLKKKIGMRMLMDIIPLDATLVKGSHGRVPEDKGEWPIVAGKDVPKATVSMDATRVFDIIYDHLISK